jgi:hypothetical protein
MSKWSRLKVAVLTTTATLAAFQLLGCLNMPGWDTIIKYVAIGSIFD